MVSTSSGPFNCSVFVEVVLFESWIRHYAASCSEVYIAPVLGVSVAPTPDVKTPSIGLMTPGALCRFAVWSWYVKRSACDLHEQFWLARAPVAYALTSLKCFDEQSVFGFRDAKNSVTRNTGGGLTVLVGSAIANVSNFRCGEGTTW